MARDLPSDREREPIADKLAPKGKSKYQPTLRDLGRAIAERKFITISPLDNLTADAYTKNEDTMQDTNGITKTRDDVASMRVYGVIHLADIERSEGGSAFYIPDSRQPLIDKLWVIAERIDLAENFSIRIGVDEKHPAPYGAVFVQVRCWRRDVITGQWGFGWGGKATVSQYQTDSEIVGMIFGLYKAYFEHEARETFKFEDRRVFGPHIDVKALWSVARKVDVRSAQHTTDKL